MPCLIACMVTLPLVHSHGFIYKESSFAWMILCAIAASPRWIPIRNKLLWSKHFIRHLYSGFGHNGYIMLTCSAHEELWIEWHPLWLIDVRCASMLHSWLFWRSCFHILKIRLTIINKISIYLIYISKLSIILWGWGRYKKKWASQLGRSSITVAFHHVLWQVQAHWVAVAGRTYIRRRMDAWLSHLQSFVWKGSQSKGLWSGR